MKKIAVLNDLSGMGKCSLTAAIPVISVMGVQACPLPTAVLSSQTGYASYFCDVYTDRMQAIMDEWEKQGFKPEGIYTGFLADETQAGVILTFFERFCGADTLVLVDPVMGDQGHTYGIYTEGLCGRMREMAARAHVITPNLTEALLLLYGKEEMEKRWEALSRLKNKEYLEQIEGIAGLLEQRFSLQAAVITGVDYQESGESPKIGNLVREMGECTWVFSQKEGGSYSGTGDLFASVLCAGLVKGISMVHCVRKAAAFLAKAIRDAVAEGTDRNDGVCFERYLYELSDAAWESGAEGRTK